MAAADRYYGSAYETGSAARELPGIPEKELRRQKKEQVQEARRQIEARVHEKRLASKEFAAPQVLVLALAMMLLVGAVSLFIVRLSIQESALREIEQLELKIQTVQHENTILRNVKNSSIDYDEVYAVATEELGMTIPGKQQMIYYTQPSVEFVHKYGDIPK